VNQNVFNLIKYQPEREAGELEHVDDSLRDGIAQHTGDNRLLPWTVFRTWFADQIYTAVRDEAGQARQEVTGPLHGSQNLGILPEAGDAPGAAQPRVVFENRKPLQVNVDDDQLPAEVESELDLVGFPR
jgi:hypothetical protein